MRSWECLNPRQAAQAECWCWGPVSFQGRVMRWCSEEVGNAWNCDILPLRNHRFWTQFVSRSMWFRRCVSCCFLLRSLCCCSVLNQTPRGAPWMYSVQLVQMVGEQNRGEWGEQCLLSGLSMALSGICEMIWWQILCLQPHVQKWSEMYSILSFSGRRGRPVTLLEKNKELGKKIRTEDHWFFFQSPSRPSSVSNLAAQDQWRWPLQLHQHLGAPSRRVAVCECVICTGCVDVGRSDWSCDSTSFYPWCQSYMSSSTSPF